MRAAVVKLCALGADQGVYAATFFLSHVCAARWLSRESYGDLAVTGAVYGFLFVVYHALVVEPELVLRGASIRKGWRSFLGQGSLALDVILIILLGSIAVARTGPNAHRADATVLLGMMIIAAVPLFMMMYLRRMEQIAGRPAQATGIAALHFIFTGLMIWRQRLSGSFDVVSFWVDLGLAAAVTVLIHRIVFGPRRMASPASDKRGGDYQGGRALLAAIANWTPINLYLFTLAQGRVESQEASFRALINLLMPAMQAMQVVQLALVPIVSARLSGGDRFFLRRFLLSVSGFTLLSAIILATGLYSSADTIVEWLYRGNYVFSNNQILAVSLYIAVSFTALVFKSVIRARLDYAVLLRIDLIVALWALLSCAWIVQNHGGYGHAVWALAAGAVLSLGWSAGYVFGKAVRVS
jgi:O-antigen/teichoic acid export membrane protein